MAALANFTFYSMAPVFTHDIGYSLKQASYFMSAAVLGGLLLQWPVGKISDLLDRRWVIAATSFLVGVVSFMVFEFSGKNLGLLILMATC